MCCGLVLCAQNKLNFPSCSNIDISFKCKIFLLNRIDFIDLGVEKSYIISVFFKIDRIILLGAICLVKLIIKLFPAVADREDGTPYNLMSHAYVLVLLQNLERLVSWQRTAARWGAAGAGRGALVGGAGGGAGELERQAHVRRALAALTAALLQRRPEHARLRRVLATLGREGGEERDGEPPPPPRDCDCRPPQQLTPPVSIRSESTAESLDQLSPSESNI